MNATILVKLATISNIFKMQFRLLFLLQFLEVFIFKEKGSRKTMRKQDLTGQKFGRLTVISEVPKANREGSRKNRPQWYCQCDCGNTIQVNAGALRTGNTKSCGCLKLEKITELGKKPKNFKKGPRKVRNDLTGKQFGKWTVLKVLPERKNKLVIYECQCECGIVKEVMAQNLVNGSSKSCGCVKYPKGSNSNNQKPIFDLKGQKFGRLTILERAPNIGKATAWKCQCDCGNIKIVRTYTLRSGQTKSCGCLQIETAISKLKIHNDETRPNRTDPKLIAARNVYVETYNDGNISLQQFIKLSQLNCFYCDTKPANSRLYSGRLATLPEEECRFIYNGLDIINSKTNPSRPYIHNLDNIVVCCGKCNMAKHTTSFEDFCTMIMRIATNKNRKQPVINQSIEQIKELMFEQKLLQIMKNGKIFRTNKGYQFYRRFWTYDDNTDLTFEHFFILSQLPCYYCDSPGTNYATYKDHNKQLQRFFYNGVDRKDSSLPHTIENCLPCCWLCNKTKRKTSDIEFIDWAKNSYNSLHNKNIITDNSINVEPLQHYNYTIDNLCSANNY